MVQRNASTVESRGGDAADVVWSPLKFADSGALADCCERPFTKPSSRGVDGKRKAAAAGLVEQGAEQGSQVHALPLGRITTTECPQHQFLLLTKRPERMLEWFRWIGGNGDELEIAYDHADEAMIARGDAICSPARRALDDGLQKWPLRNAWLGISAEDQPTLEARAGALLQCPARVHWISAEPLLGPLDVSPYACLSGVLHCDDIGVDIGTRPVIDVNGVRGHDPWLPALRWVVVGGESGTGARPCEVAWIRSIRDQCQAAAVPVFVKQVGARPHHVGRWTPEPLDYERVDPDGCAHLHRVVLRDRKGGDMSEWPEDLRIREFPPQAPAR